MDWSAYKLYNLSKVGAGIGTRSRRFADINLPRFVLEGNIPAADRIIDDFIAAAKLAGMVHNILKTFLIQIPWAQLSHRAILFRVQVS